MAESSPVREAKEENIHAPYYLAQERIQKTVPLLDRARVRTAGLAVNREDLRWAVRDVADAVEDLAWALDAIT